LVAWLSIALGSIFIYLSVGQFLALFVTPSGMSSSPSQSARDFVRQYGQGIGLTLIFVGQWIRGRKPRLKLRRLPRFGKAALLIVLIAAFHTPIGHNAGLIVPVFAWGGATHKETLTQPAIIKAVTQTHMGGFPYLEMNSKTGFGEDIKYGVGHEDDSPRDFYHFYFPASDPAPDSGLAWKWYFPIRSVLDGCEVSGQPGDHFINAYRWARDGGGTMGDQLNWCGALKAYDYTPESKVEAYRRLGHVVHLLEDMSEPDHTMLRAHPGSGLKMSELLDSAASIIGTIVGICFGGSLGGLAGYFLGKAIAWVITAINGDRLGFERLIRERSEDQGPLPIPTPGPEYYPSLKAYFDLMATESETYVSATGLLDGRTALGVDDLNIGPIIIPTLLFGDIELFKGFETGIPILPAIDPNDPVYTPPYHSLTDVLGSKAVARAAGLMMWFYDIVNFPPYVKQVTVTQGGEIKYKAEWQDHTQWDGDIGADRVVSRKLMTPTNKTLESGKLAEIRVVFGPIGGKKENPIPKSVGHIQIMVGGEPAENLQLVSGTVNEWTASFTPHSNGCDATSLGLAIRAIDFDNHHITGFGDDDGSRPDGYSGEMLDSDPSSPAKLLYHPPKPTPPYEFTWYTPGWDEDHYKVTVKPTSGFASVTPTEASLHPLAGQSYHFNIIMSSGPADYKLKVLGLPVGAQAEFFPSASVHVPPPPQTANLILKITVSSSTPVGTYKLQIVDEQYTPSLFVPSPCYPEITLNVAFPTIQPMEADFTISVNPSNSTVEPGSSTTTKIRVSSVTLPIYGSTVSLSLSPPPAGFTLTLSPPSTSGQPYFERTMEVKVGSTVEAGKSYQITVTGTGSDGKTHSAIFTVHVKRPESRGDFAIKVNPSSSTVQAGSYTTAQVLVTSTAIPDVYTLPVTLSSSPPPGFTVTFSPPSPAAPPVFTKLMQVTVQPTVKPGSYTITITGTGTDYRIHHATFTVIVQDPATIADFAISANPSSTTIQPGGTNTVYVSVTTNPSNPYTLTVFLSYSPPNGFTVSFSPQPPSGQCPFTKSMTINAASTVKPGNYPIMITGTGTDGKTHSTTFTAIVLAQFDMNIISSSLLQTVIKGQTATYTITITLISGSTQPVSLDLRGLPSGATFYFRPNTGNPTFTSTLLVTTTTQTPRGDYTLTIVASSRGVVKSTTVTIRIVEPVRGIAIQPRLTFASYG